MDLLGMLGINRNDVLDFYKLLERGVVALERLADATETFGGDYQRTKEKAEEGASAAFYGSDGL